MTHPEALQPETLAENADLAMNQQPYKYLKFGAPNNGFTEVGEAMLQWAHRGRLYEFTISEWVHLLRYLEHRHLGDLSDIIDLKREIKELKKKLKECEGA